jgi:hypothetical protein
LFEIPRELYTSTHAEEIVLEEESLSFEKIFLTTPQVRKGYELKAEAAQKIFSL